MSGALNPTKGTYLPIPTGGLNLISPPLEIEPNEALQLQDYSVFSWGIRERGSFASYDTVSNSGNGAAWAMPYVYEAGVPIIASPQFLVISSNTGGSTIISQYDVNSKTTTNLTYGGPNLGGSGFNFSQVPCVFNGFIYIGNRYNNIGITWQIGTATVNTLASQFTAAAGTGSYGSLFAPFAYKRRLYFIQFGTNIVWFANPLAVLGTLNPFDFSTLVPDGSKILFAFSWGYNQGLANDELFVVITDSGQTIIYSGDWPAASNWTLVSRTQIPTPSGSTGYLKQGQNVFIETVRGIVSLKDFLAGSQSISDNYYIISKNLGPITTIGSLYPVINSVDPFIYFASPDPANLSLSTYFYVLNYELGAWSIYSSPITISTVVGLIADPNSKKVYICTTTGAIILYNPDVSKSSIDVPTPTWQTPFLKLVNNPAPATQKIVAMVRAIVRSIAGGNGNIITSCAVANDFKTIFGSSSFQTLATGITTANSNYTVQEIVPPGQGRYLSFKFAKTEQGELDEIGGIEVYWQDGTGAY